MHVCCESRTPRFFCAQSLPGQAQSRWPRDLGRQCRGQRSAPHSPGRLPLAVRRAGTRRAQTGDSETPGVTSPTVGRCRRARETRSPQILAALGPSATALLGRQPEPLRPPLRPRLAGPGSHSSKAPPASLSHACTPTESDRDRDTQASSWLAARPGNAEVISL